MKTWIFGPGITHSLPMDKVNYFAKNYLIIEANFGWSLNLSNSSTAPSKRLVTHFYVNQMRL